jgi:DNA-binding CsgD family transcriptional regulator
MAAPDHPLPNRFTYTQGYEDGRQHSRAGKPLLYSVSDYGNGFLNGWRSVRDGGGPEVGASTLGSLTHQEIKIALTVSMGMTNRQTANLLFISPKTVEHHLSRIYDKLKVSSRSQLTRLITSIETEPEASWYELHDESAGW